MWGRWLAWGWLGLCIPASASVASEPATLTGKALTLAEVLRPAALATDDEPAGSQVVIVAEDGSIVPLIADEASRALFRDDRLRHRRVEVRGRREAGSPYLRVVSFKVEDGGVLKTPEYFCEICNIGVRSPQICPCCQGPMDLRMKPGPPP